MTHENYDVSFPDQPVVDLYLPLWANLPAFRHKPAFIWAEDRPAGDPANSSPLTYAQLNSAVQSISSHLLLSLQKGDAVVLLCEPGLELVEIIFACQRAGLRAIPITPPHLSSLNDNHHLVRVLSQTKPKAAIAGSSYIRRARDYSSSSSSRLAKLLTTFRWIATEELNSESNQQSNVNSPYNGCRANDVYLIQYTSGATGIPKPVVVTAGAAAHNVRAARRSYNLHPSSIIVSWLPQYHDCGLMFLVLTVVSGATCVLTSPNAFINRPRLWLELITKYNATCTPVPSFTLPLVVRRGGVDKGTSQINLVSMKNLIIINEPIYESSIEEFIRVFAPLGLSPSSISPSYGLAENCTFVSTAWRSESDCRFPIHKNLLPSAKLPTSREEMLEEDIDIMVVNEETHEPVDDGVEGEIWIASPSNAAGYLDHPALTREVFNGRLRNKVAGLYVRTGDRGVVAGEERYLYVMGRCSDIIKGSKHPHYIETAAYNSCPKLLRPGCLAAFEHLANVVVVAELLKHNVETKFLVKICEGIRHAVLNEEKIDVGLVILAKSRSVPKTTSGKIQRWAAKYALERNQLSEVMRVEFGADGSKSTRFGARMQGVKEREKNKIRAVGEEREGILLAGINTGGRLSVLSSL